MVSPETQTPVRISKIADRFLVFDAEDVARIRRNHNMCSVLVGTTPQNPTQNVFLSLPLELLPEETSVLVENKVGRIVDEASHHQMSLCSSDASTREAYIALLKDRRRKAQKLLAEDQAKKAATEQARRGTSSNATAEKTRSQADASSAGNVSLTVTPTTSDGLELPSGERSQSMHPPAAGPLHRHLQARGYFMTPGLRFGANYSVYPGDPLRYHAHFLATNYNWNEKIPMLDVVGSGRLGTSVKKGFLFGGEIRNEDGSEKNVRTFCVEWAGM
ncbi:putative tRNA-splicing endonuclease subunit tsp-4 [Colletotrichum chlorophyti]|uniref:tRNA-splicing endonuclease subunit Sen34 n=1 Tax=Colletotrichum chlorophyti TaxID=708187 RepID=A0A1Q8S7W3_9PEZI|nr:putative tRNA-splicing endonuclease subunit tsp-4 [Colletotrichum chlorophyti]